MIADDSVPGGELTNPFELVSVCAVAAPAGHSGSGWHRYEIVQGINRIVGYREGASENITADINRLVVKLNERRIHKRGRVQVVLAPRSAGWPRA